MNDAELISLVRKTILHFSEENYIDDLGVPEIIELADKVVATLALAGALEDGLYNDVRRHLLKGKDRRDHRQDTEQELAEIEYDDDGGMDVEFGGDDE